MGEKKDDVKRVKDELVVNYHEKIFVPKMERPEPWPEPPKQEDSANQNKKK